MHVVSASAAFNVALRRAIRPPSILSAKVKSRLQAARRALTLAMQALLFAAFMWLMLAAPALLSEQQGPNQPSAAFQASR